MPPLGVVLPFSIIIGLIAGSFLNVVIYRSPLILLNKQPQHSPFNLAVPASHCPHCQHRLRWFHNIPLLSYLCLRGRCAFCQTAISWHYPVVELSAALITIPLVFYYQNTLLLGLAFLFSWTLIALIAIDLKHQLLPNSLTLPLLWLGLFVNCFNLFTSLQNAVFGAIAGYLVFWLIGTSFQLLRKKDGLGGGDMKLLAALGAWLGWQYLPFIVLLSSILCIITLGSLILFKKHKVDEPFAYGPFLAIAGWLALFIPTQWMMGL